MAARRIAGRSEGWNCPCPYARGTSLSSPSTRPVAATVSVDCATLKPIFCGGLPRIPSDAAEASARPSAAAAGPAASTSANAKVVAVVISPSVPRRTTVTGSRSATMAQPTRMNNSRSAWRRTPAPSWIAKYARAAKPVSVTTATYGFSREVRRFGVGIMIVGPSRRRAQRQRGEPPRPGRRLESGYGCLAAPRCPTTCASPSPTTCGAPRDPPPLPRSW